MRTANPALATDTLIGMRGMAVGKAMSIQGTVNRTAVLLAIALISSAWIWGRAFAGAPVQGFIALGAVAGFIVALVTIFMKALAPITAPLYAGLEGLVLGGISAMFEASYPGVAIQAVTLTFGVMAALLIAYTSRLIVVTARFRLGVVAATGGIMLVYLASFVLGFFGVSMPLLHDNGLIGIGISLFIVAVAALNLVLDFDFIERGAQGNLPKYMEWYGAFGLMVTLIWLYLEMIRLLAKLRSRQ